MLHSMIQLTWPLQGDMRLGMLHGLRVRADDNAIAWRTDRTHEVHTDSVF